MKAKYLFICAALALPFVASCNQEGKDDPSKPNYQEMTFNASIPAVGTVATGWASGDAISIFDGKANQKFVTSESGAAVTFSGTANASAKEFMAVSPYDKNLSRKSGKVTLSIPAAQEVVPGTFDSALNRAVAYTTGSELKFVNVPAYVKFELDAEGYNVVSVSLEAVGGEQLSGDMNVALTATPTVEPAGGSAKVTLAGVTAEGVNYAVVIPSTLSQGLKVAVTDENDSRAEVIVSDVALKMGEVTDLGTITPTDWREAENPNPTDVAKSVIIKASFSEADFNLVTDAEYADLPSNMTFDDHKYNTMLEWNYQADPFVLTTTTYDGKTYHRLKATEKDAWLWHRIMQVVPLEMYTDYVFSFMGNSNARPFCGVEAYNEPNIMNRQEVPFDAWRTPELAPDLVNGSYETAVQLVEKEFNSGDAYFGDCYIGLWGHLDGTVDFRDWKLIPKGYDKKSMKLASVQALGRMKNATFDELTDVERYVVWDDAAGTINVACSKAEISGTVIDNAVAVAKETSNASNITIGKFNKSRGLILPAIEGVEGISGMVPDAAISVGGKTYMHYYAETAPGWMRDNGTAYERYIAYSGFVVSEDGGKTWSLPEHGRTWTPFNGSDHASYWPNSYTCFAQASLCQKGDYVYMLGTLPGRYPNVQLGWAETKRTFYAARAAATSDISDPQSWEYWSGTEWVANEDDVRIMGSLTAGTWAEPCVVYNPKFDRFMMIYRSFEGGLVFKDADKIEGPWSGTKILTTDTDFGACYAASVLKVDANGDLYIVASQL